MATCSTSLSALRREWPFLLDLYIHNSGHLVAVSHSNEKVQRRVSNDIHSTQFLAGGYLIRHSSHMLRNNDLFNINQMIFSSFWVVEQQGLPRIETSLHQISSPREGSGYQSLIADQSPTPSAIGTVKSWQSVERFQLDFGIAVQHSASMAAVTSSPVTRKVQRKFSSAVEDPRGKVKDEAPFVGLRRYSQIRADGDIHFVKRRG
jgi:hypothetical protein